jgi:F-type H+-transporting ATPase subunit b
MGVLVPCFRRMAITVTPLVAWIWLGGVLPVAALAADTPAADTPVSGQHEGAGDAAKDAAETPHAVDDSHAGHGAGHAIDPYNKTDANASRHLEDPKEVRFELAICTLIVFVLLVALLARVAWRPIMTGLEHREQSIVSRIEEAQRSADEAASQLQAYRDKLASAADEAQGIINQARVDAEQLAEKIRQQATADASRERDRAIADIQSAKNAALGEMAERAADMAVGLAGRIVRRELKPEEHAALISEAVDRFASNN